MMGLGKGHPVLLEWHACLEGAAPKGCYECPLYSVLDHRRFVPRPVPVYQHSLAR
jgi:hypothetical protein